MYRIFLCFFILFFSIVPAMAARTITTRTPYYNNSYFYQQHYNNGIYPKRYRYNPNYSEISALEKYALNRNYTKESNLNRLQRLEMQTFGAIQQGDFDTRYDNVRSAILSRPKAHSNNSVWRNIGNYFSGQMTGFTPSIDTYTNESYYIPNYGRSSFSEFSSPFGGRNMRTRNYGTSSGTGITILD